MGNVSLNTAERVRKVSKILISQPEPTTVHYNELITKHGVELEFNSLIHVEAVSPREFRKQRISFIDYTAVVFYSKNSVDFFFKSCEDIRFKMSAQTKYFCQSQAIANYLQKFIVYRKRKVYAADRSISELKDYFLKNKEERFLIPCNITGSKQIGAYLESLKLNYSDVHLYRTVSSDIKELDINQFDMLVFFSHNGVQSLFENFPDYQQGNTRVAVFGNSTLEAAEQKGLIVDLLAPTPEAPSMQMALDNYLKVSNA